MNHRIRQGILATVGQTPLVRLANLAPDSGLEIHAKLERFNPTGSIEDRTALDLVLAPVQTGEIVPGRPVVLEASCGNLAISLAQVCRYYDLDLHVVVDADAVTVWHRAMLHTFGANVRVVHAAAAGSTAAQDRLTLAADALAATLPGAWRPARGSRPGPRGAAVLGEIRAALPAEVDYLFCPTSVPVMLRDAVAHIRTHRLATRMVAVADEPSAGYRPDFGLGPADLVEPVDEAEVVAGCRRLLGREGLLAGRSSGAVVAALARLRDRIEPGAVCVLVLPDGGDRYAGTVYSDAWVESHVGTTPELHFNRQEATQ